MKYAEKYTPLRSQAVADALRQAEPILERLIVAQDEADIRDAIALFASTFGVLMSGHISVISHSPHHTAHYAITDRMDPYTADYLDLGLVDVDPVLWRGQREILPIPWGLDEHRNHLDDTEKPLYGLLDDYGLRCGMLVPIHGPNGYSALGIAIDEDEASFRKRMPAFGKIAQLVATHVHDAVRRTVGVPQVAGVPHLTPRERECLTWVAAGKTAWEIGQILHLAETTVVYYCENAKKRLESKTMPQAVARAIAFGLIRL